jgi:NADH oxidase (H2O2-forming)
MSEGSLKERFVVIGNGVAGYSAASTIKRYKKEATVSIVSHEPYPLYSACALGCYLAGEIKREVIFLESFSSYECAGIKTRLGQKVMTIDTQRRELVLESGELMCYDKLILATGSRVLRPSIEGMGKKGVFELKSISDVDKILSFGGKRAVVIGSGPIGIEVTVALKKQGLEVYLIESLPRILPRLFDEAPSYFLKRRLEAKGVKVFCGETVIEVLHRGNVMELITNQRKVSCDLIILATGMVPNSEIAREAGIKLGELKGISVDDRMRTSAEGIYACGDCVETRDALTGMSTLSLLWHTARRQGQIAGLNALGIEERYPGSVNYVGVDVFGIQAVSLGILKNDDPSISVVEKSGDAFIRRFLLKDGTVQGIQIVGDLENIGKVMNLVRNKVPLYKILARKETDFVSFMGLSRLDFHSAEFS